MMKLPRGMAIVMVAASLAACSAPELDTGASPSPTRSLSDLLTPSPSPTLPSYTVSDVVPEELDAAIRADLTDRGVDGAAAEVVETRKVTWNNGALGCPQPGMSYTQAQISGWQVLVTLDGVSYDYRFGNDATPLLCELPTITGGTDNSDI